MKFSVYADVSPGDYVVLVGKACGWNPKDGVKLQLSTSAFSEWFVDVEDEGDFPFGSEYKYVVIKPDGFELWEEGDNRRVSEERVIHNGRFRLANVTGPHWRRSVERICPDLIQSLQNDLRARVEEMVRQTLTGEGTEEACRSWPSYLFNCVTVEDLNKALSSKQCSFKLMLNETKDSCIRNEEEVTRVKSQLLTQSESVRDLETQLAKAFVEVLALRRHVEDIREGHDDLGISTQSQLLTQSESVRDLKTKLAKVSVEVLALRRDVEDILEGPDGLGISTFQSLRNDLACLKSLFEKESIEVHALRGDRKELREFSDGFGKDTIPSVRCHIESFQLQSANATIEFCDLRRDVKDILEKVVDVDSEDHDIGQNLVGDIGPSLASPGVDRVESSLLEESRSKAFVASEKIAVEPSTGECLQAPTNLGKQTDARVKTLRSIPVSRNDLDASSRLTPFFSSPILPADDDGAEIALRIERELLRSLKDPVEERRRLLKKQWLKCHPDKSRSNSAFLWFQAWQEAHEDWFLGEGLSTRT